MKIKNLFFAALLALVVAACSSNGSVENVTIETKADSAHYLLGYDYGKNLFDNRAQIPGDSLNQQAVAAGFVAGITGKEGKVSVDDIRTFVNAYFMEAQSMQAENNLTEAETFLAETAEKAGVTSLMDGKLLYEVLKEGDGAKPTIEDQVEVHYAGTLIDGTEFDSSIERGTPATFGLKGVIKGWTEILQLMPAGSKWKVYIHPELGYGEQGNQSIPGNSALIFEIELIDIKK